MKNRILKPISFILILTMLLVVLVSCESMPLKSNKKALTTVGQVDKFDVAYEEFYFLTNSYRKQLDKKYGDNAGSTEYLNELSTLVGENIVSNYAVLKLAEDAGLSLEDEEVQDNIQAQIDKYIESDFGGKRSAYIDSLKEMGATDNYIRFSLGVDILYSGLVSEYLDSGVINDDNDFIIETINNEFIRTKHIMILNGNGSEENLAKAEEALEKIENGTSFDKMIGSKYNNDFMLTTSDGYYFTKGTMAPEYESAAYELEVGEISGIVASVGENSLTGEQEDCYYIIQRLPLEEKYINKNFDELKEEYFSSVVYGMVDELKSNMTFSMNEYGNSLDLLDLEAPKQTDTLVVLVALTIGLALLLATGVVVLIVYKKKKINQRVLAAKNNK